MHGHSDNSSKFTVTYAGMHAGQFRITEFVGFLQQVAIGSSDFHHTSAKMKFPYINTVPSRKRAHYGISAHPPLWAQFPARV